MITVVDYGMGNLRSVTKALESLGADTLITSDPEHVRNADTLIVPGVGAFGDAMHELAARDLIAPVQEYVASDRLFLGICLGMQIMFDSSEEAPGVAGLSLIAGTVDRFPASVGKVPHMGWNQLELSPDVPLWAELTPSPYVYFVHSYYVRPQDPSVVAATTHYGFPFASAVAKGRCYGVQFHPEKSQTVGLGILRNFVGLSEALAVR